MRMASLSCAVVAVLGAGLSAGCMAPFTEPPAQQASSTHKVVVTGARANLMLLVDKSGSMNLAADPTVAGCESCAEVHCPSTCPKTRIGELRSGMQAFLTGPRSTVARMGLLPYPSNNVCGAPTLQAFPSNGVALDHSSTDAEPELRATALAINEKVQAEIFPGGGTPTGGSLMALAAYDKLLASEREDFVLLVTDSLPNCSQALDRSTCICTGPKMPDGTCPSQSANQCLDSDGVVAAASTLRSKGIRTIVVGFGPEAAAASGPLVDVLAATAEAGGYPPACPMGTDEECGGGPGACGQEAKLCSRYYKAPDGPALTQVLNDIAARVASERSCEFQLPADPSAPTLESVSIDGVLSEPGESTWTSSSGKVTFLGALCTQLKGATPAAPVTVEFTRAPSR